MNSKRGPLSRNLSWPLAAAACLVLLLVACGTAAQQPAASDAPASEPAATLRRSRIVRRCETLWTLRGGQDDFQQSCRADYAKVLPRGKG